MIYARCVRRTLTYKLISYIDVLKEILDMYPDTKGDIHEKIEHYEYTLDGAYFGDCDRLFRDNPITSVSHL